LFWIFIASGFFFTDSGSWTPTTWFVCLYNYFLYMVLFLTGSESDTFKIWFIFTEFFYIFIFADCQSETLKIWFDICLISIGFCFLQNVCVWDSYIWFDGCWFLILFLTVGVFGTLKTWYLLILMGSCFLQDVSLRYSNFDLTFSNTLLHFVFHRMCVWDSPKLTWCLIIFIDLTSQR